MQAREQAGAPFLDDLTPTVPRMALPAGFALRGVYFRPSNHIELEVMVLDAVAEPRSPALRQAWRERQASRAAPLLVVALHAGDAMLFGPDTDRRPTRRVRVAQAERLCRRALEMPDRYAALRFLIESLPGIDGDLPGIRNEGLLTEHELLRGAMQRDDWGRAQEKATAVLARADAELLHGLGFAMAEWDGVTRLLSAGDQRAVAVLLDARETPEDASPRFAALSPVAWALNAAQRCCLPWVVMVQQDRIRLYPADIGVGVGERGRTDTWLEYRLPLLRQDQAGLLWLTMSAEALSRGGTLETLLESSRRFAAELATRLRERIYDRVVPRLATGIARARALIQPSEADLRLTYSMAMTMLFRLLFIAYAEDRDFLPYSTNEAYRDGSLKRKAIELARSAGAQSGGTGLWRSVEQLFEAIRNGDARLGVPTYGGGLFETDPAISPVGSALQSVSLADSIFAPALSALLLDEARDLGDPGRGPVDFRSLRVREFGTIYEGLLESELAVADTDLALQLQGKELVYLPARAGEPVVVERAGIFLHNRSGARKSSGSYFTPAFAVDHLLDAALEPALQAHVERLANLDEEAASASFFDIKIADIAMGSGHFLVAALDRTEQKLSGVLAERRLRGVLHEIAALRKAAETELARLGQEKRIEDGQVLRRLIARRCLYGVDINPLAVDLARLSIWVHTFVPGLPLSLLDHALLQGNSLTGVASLRQANSQLRAWLGVGVAVEAKELLAQAEPHLQRLAAIADATPADVAEARRSHDAARDAVGAAKSLFDAGVCHAMGNRELQVRANRQLSDLEREGKALDLRGTPVYASICVALEAAQPLHLPLAFPEVFLRERSGFDVVIGNPPWDKVRVEKHEFWARYFPGLRGIREPGKRDAQIMHLAGSRPDLVARELAERRESEAVRDTVRNLPGMNTGHPDLFRAFMARFAQILVRDGGYYGVVLPGDAFKIKGNRPVRETLDEIASSVDVQFLTNKAGWVFPDVHAQKLFALVAVRLGGRISGGCQYRLRPEFHQKGAFLSRDREDCVTRDSEWLRRYSAGLVPPTLPTSAASISVDVLDKFMASPRISAHPILRARRIYADIETSRDKACYVALNSEASLWPVYGGDSFTLWSPDTGTYYAMTTMEKALPLVQSRRVRSPSNSAYGAMPRIWRDNADSHPCLRPRLAFRNVSHRTNQRTLLTALVPPNRVLVETAPWVLWLSPDTPLAHEAFLLAVMSSIPCDWWVRRFVEGHVDEEAFDCLRIPDADPMTGLGARAVALAGRLACPDDRFAGWAASVGVAYGKLPAAEKQAMIEELDAVVARLYGLDADALAHIFDTFHDWPTIAQRREWEARRDRSLAMLRELT